MKNVEHVMTAAQLEALAHAHVTAADVRRLHEPFDLCEVRARLVDGTSERHLRPGGTVSGPTQMMLADTAAYFLVLSLVGPVPLAVTTHLSINFMRKPAPGPLEADARILKLGKRLAVCDVLLGDPEAPVAHAQVTYSIPPPDHR